MVPPSPSPKRRLKKKEDDAKKESMELVRFDGPQSISLDFLKKEIDSCRIFGYRTFRCVTVSIGNGPISGTGPEGNPIGLATGLEPSRVLFFGRRRRRSQSQRRPSSIDVVFTSALITYCRLAELDRVGRSVKRHRQKPNKKTKQNTNVKAGRHGPRRRKHRGGGVGAGGGLMFLGAAAACQMQRALVSHCVRRCRDAAAVLSIRRTANSFRRRLRRWMPNEKQNRLEEHL